jgi:quinolinate synthase
VSPAPTKRSTAALQAKIRKLAEQRNAVILAHNYERPEVQDVADYVGDSLGLSQRAAATGADVIVFCAVHFMAETAAILSPQKTVLLPDLGAGCSLADTIDAEQLRAWKHDNPGAVVVSYVNTTAEVKAESDYCCTSGNAKKVIDSIPADTPILFLPDMFLGLWLERTTGRKLKIWPGECHVHAGIRPADIESARDRLAGAPLLIHPECGCASQCMTMAAEGKLSDVQILSTEGMVRFAKLRGGSGPYLVATETGILHRLEKEVPEAQFHAVSEHAICRYMKLTTLEKVHASLAENVFRVTVEPEIAERARGAIDRMLECV